jgi:hypothetical protein
MPAATSGYALSGVVAATGYVSSSEAISASKVNGGLLAIAMVKSNGFQVGEFAFIYYEIPAST